MKRVLIIDDEPSITTLLEFNLIKEGYSVKTALDGLDGYGLAATKEYDFIILDLMLPSMNGIDICKKLRQEKINTPILMLTAKDDEIGKIIGLELGADDYMTKPFSPREVLARIKAIMRRVDNHTEDNNPEKKSEIIEEDETIEIGQIVVFPKQYGVYVREEQIELTRKEFELLLYLIKRHNRIISREQLFNAIWSLDHAEETRIVDVHISHLRKKIEIDTREPKYIKTIRGFGYKFEGPKI